MINNAIQPMDFALSYAGEDAVIGKEIARRLRELGYDVFFAGDVKHLIAGANGEELFERLFAQAKEVIVLISEHYKRKEWTRFEWDVIRERLTRFIAVRLDNVKILGLPSNIFYVPFDGGNYDDIVKACVSRLLAFERIEGIARPTEYERILNAIRNESSGATAQAYQLARDRRRRDPLEDVEAPDNNEVPCYRIAEYDWSNTPVIKRLSIKIVVPGGLSQSQLRFNMMHCAAEQFNMYKPAALMVLAYKEGTPIDGAYSAGRTVFAPFGKWEKAQDGYAYNIPVAEFKFSVDLNATYS